MLTLPSMWNLVISTIVFFIAVWYTRHFLDEHGLPKGVTRGMLVIVIASLASCGAGDVVDWAQQKMEGSQPAVQTSGDLSQLLKDVGQAQSLP